MCFVFLVQLCSSSRLSPGGHRAAAGPPGDLPLQRGVARHPALRDRTALGGDTVGPRGGWPRVAVEKGSGGMVMSGDGDCDFSSSSMFLNIS